MAGDETVTRTQKRALAITALASGLMSPTSLVVGGGLAIAKVGHDKYLRFLWSLLVGLFVAANVAFIIAATLAGASP